MRLASLLSLALLACGPARAAIDVAPGIDFEARVDSAMPMPAHLAARLQDNASERLSGQRKQSEAERLRKAKAKQPSAGAAAQAYQPLVDHVHETTDDFRDQNVSESEDRDRLKDPPPPL
jgi:hypothetical protein